MVSSKMFGDIREGKQKTFDVKKICKVEGCSKIADGPWGEYCEKHLRQKARREEEEIRRAEIAEMEEDN